jgi:Domain of unknown function (DUF4159)/Aerotolerance regulator N-terminal
MMQWLSSLSFVTPLALLALLALPIIWWLLRFTPPRPQSIKFPPLRILLSLQSKEETPDKTPWWLLVMRLTMAALLIFAVAHPLLSNGASTTQSSGPLLVIVDDGWTAAKSWSKRMDALRNILDEARNSNRLVTLVTTTAITQPKTLSSMAASDALNASRALQPQALNTDRMALLARLKSENVKAASVTWLTDGIDAGSANNFASGLKALYGQNLTAFTFETVDNPIALARPTIEGSDIKVTALRNINAAPTATIQATAGNGRVLAEAPITFASGATTISTKLNLPIELRNEIQSISISNENHAGARQLLDDRWRRKTIAIQSGVTQESAQPLLSPLHYVTRALEPFADLHEPANATELQSQLDAGLSMLILADIGKLPQESHDAIAPWIEKGGVLLRFAGPRLAAATDNLMPVNLREGDRNLGSALSWESPQAIQAFTEMSPFAGLTIDNRITVTRQVLAEPDIDLADKTWASLTDGTPLVTAKHQGKGLIILFHVTANADWSNLPLSGTFVEMLQRIVDLAPAAGSNKATATKDDTSSTFAPRLFLSGSGELVSPSATANAIAADRFDATVVSAQTPAGIYARGGQERAINLDLKEVDLAPITAIALQKIAPPTVTNFAPLLFIAAAIMFLLDTLAALFLGGAFNRPRRATVMTIIVAAFMAPLLLHAPCARADDSTAMQAALETHLAYVKTGDSEIDQTSQQGLKGLGLVLADRTSAVLGNPIGINIESDEIVFFPLLYWPVTEADQAPGSAALSRIDAFMKNGGTIFFDLRDSTGDFSNNSGTTEALKRILAKLDIPPLEPVSESHVLTRSFYLLKDFPGRYATGSLWVETQNADAPSNSDGVSGIIIGSNDYAAAWALNDQGEPQNAVIPGNDRQREMAFRVGVNIVMYALTGNYKTDQVHIPALLERLGQ